MFLSGRYVRDRSLGHALSEGFRGLLMVGRSPVAFLHLDVPPEEVDVNVHPTKVEVRFRDGQRIYAQLLATFRQTFLASDLHSKLQIPRDAEPAAEAPTADSPAFAMEPRPNDRQSVASWFTPGGASRSRSSPSRRPATPAGRPTATGPGGAGFVRAVGRPPQRSTPSFDRALVTNPDFDEFAPPGTRIGPVPQPRRFRRDASGRARPPPVRRPRPARSRRSRSTTATSSPRPPTGWW